LKTLHLSVIIGLGVTLIVIGNSNLLFAQEGGFDLTGEKTYSIIDSPLKQFKEGTPASKVVCSQGFQLIIKREDDSPACVQPDTANILIKHGWASSIIVTPPIVQQTSGNTTLPASFEPCDTPFPQSNSGIAILYMPANSIGKICVRYSNYNTFPIEPAYGIGVFDPNNSYQNVKGITIWHDPILNPIIKENSTLVVYHIKTGNQTGFYGLSVPECMGTPFAVGYGNNSKIISSDFPFLRASSCATITYTSDIDSLSGIGVKQIP